MKRILICDSFGFGEIPKLAEGAPLEREKVVNSGARVQIPLSPLLMTNCLKRKAQTVFCGEAGRTRAYIVCENSGTTICSVGKKDVKKDEKISKKHLTYRVYKCYYG